MSPVYFVRTGDAFGASAPDPDCGELHPWFISRARLQRRDLPGARARGEARALRASRMARPVSIVIDSETGEISTCVPASPTR